MSIEKMREEFEAWECDSDHGPQTDPVWLMYDAKTNTYPLDKIQARWLTWQASRAALPVWQPMETCPKHVDVLFYREDCGVINGQLTCADSFMTDKERESGDYSEDEQFSEDAWCYGPEGVERLDGDLVPTHWMPYPDEPEQSP